MAAPTHILFESSSGYALFESRMVEEIGSKNADVQKSILDLYKFGKMVRLQSFAPYKNAAHALENANDVSEGIVNDYLKELLELNLIKSKDKNSQIVLGVSDKNLASSLNGALGVACDTSPRSLELIRGVRLHAEKLLGGLQPGDLAKAQLGLGHSYSRGKVKFNVNRSDNMIIQAIALLDQLDKDVNMFNMRIREWYGYTFPELGKIVTDSLIYARAVRFIGSKSTLDQSKLGELAEILDGDDVMAKNVLDAARSSMGTDLNEMDAININHFSERVIGLAEYRRRLINYLSERMNSVAPSLTALIGERIGARLISHAGSLTNLSKYPASTVQILGAEKALFRALRTKGKTPKYGLIYHSSFIGRANAKHKGRISRLLANKCSIASRIDCYTDNPTVKFGEALHHQVEERLNFYETGAAPTKNSDAMQKVLKELTDSLGDNGQSDEEMADAESAKIKQKDTSEKKRRDKKEKKNKESPEKEKKKRKHDEIEVDEKEADMSKAVDQDKATRKAAKKAKKPAQEATEPEPESAPSSKKKHKDKGEDAERVSKKRRKSKTD